VIQIKFSVMTITEAGIAFITMIRMKAPKSLFGQELKTNRVPV